MKKVIFSMMVLSIAFYACKKDDKGSGTNPVVSKPISPDSVQLLSDSLKISHFKTSTKGALPAASGTDLVLIDEKDSIIAVNGGYAVIQPNLDGGIPSGYYIQVKGANTYFTMDLKEPITRQKAAGHKKGFMSRESSDSSIAIKLPMNLLPGTFTVQYEAYDSVNNVSNVATTIVTVVTNDQTTADFKLLLGKWTYSQEGDIFPNGDTSENWYHETFLPDSSVYNYICDDNNMLQYAGSEGTPYTTYWNKDNEATYTFTDGNLMFQHYVYTSKQLNTDSSRCGAPVYDVYNGDETDPSSYYYNSTTKQLTLIYDNSGVSNGDYYTDTYTVTSLTATQAHIQQPDGDATYHVIFTK